MARKSKSKPWRVSGVTFIDIEIKDPRERQMRIEFDGGVRIVIGNQSHLPLVAQLMEILREAKEVRL